MKIFSLVPHNDKVCFLSILVMHRLNHILQDRRSHREQDNYMSEMYSYRDIENVGNDCTTRYIFRDAG